MHSLAHSHSCTQLRTHTIAHRVSAIDSGKPMVDAAFGEVIVTCEKIWWLCAEGERYLRTERRSAGYMVRCAQRGRGAAGGTAHAANARTHAHTFTRKLTPTCPAPPAPAAAPVPTPAADVLQERPSGVPPGGRGGRHRALELPLPQHLQPADRGALCRQRHRHQGGRPSGGGREGQGEVGPPPPPSSAPAARRCRSTRPGRPSTTAASSTPPSRRLTRPPGWCRS